MSTDRAYYNDNDPKAVAWLRELIKAEVIANGDVDDRSITDIKPSDLEGYTQVHLFAGIGGWSYALRLAGWPDDRPVWTGSCPCQPFSVAGKRGGLDDSRHLWPAFRWLIAQCEPTTIFGEQVASKAGRAWLSGVRADLEAMEYGVGAADLCAAGIGAPHIRQRLFWVAESGRESSRGSICRRGEGSAKDGCRASGESGGSGNHSRLGNTESNDQRRAPLPGAHGEGKSAGGSSSNSRMANADGCATKRGLTRPNERKIQGIDEDGLIGLGNSTGEREHGRSRETEGSVNQERGEPRVPSRNSGQGDALPTGRAARRGGARNRLSPWGSGIYIPCADGKARRIEPGIEPLVNGLPGRVGLLRGYGNAIVPQVAAAFVMAYMETLD